MDPDNRISSKISRGSTRSGVADRWGAPDAAQLPSRNNEAALDATPVVCAPASTLQKDRTKRSRQTAHSLLSATIGTQKNGVFKQHSSEGPALFVWQVPKALRRTKERRAFAKGDCPIVVASCVMTYQAGQREIIPDEVILHDQCADQVIHRPLESLGCTVAYLRGPVGELDASIGIRPTGGAGP